MIKIDACGLSCPEPLLLLKKNISKDNVLVLLADSKNAVETCSQFAETKGYAVTVAAKDNHYELTIKKG